MKNRKNRPVNGKVFRSGVYSTAILAAAILLAVLVNLVVRALPSKYTEFDLSEGKMYTLGDSSVQLAQSLQQDVTIYYLCETGSEDAIITKLLDHYAAESSHIHWEQKDPTLYPTFAAQYGAENASTGSLIVTSGDDSVVLDAADLYEYDYSDYYTTGSANVTFGGEKQITAAIYKLTSGDARVAYYTTNHGEQALTSSLTEALNAQNITLQPLDLLTSEIPEDCSLLIINAPTSDLASDDGLVDEASMLQNYLNEGGKMLLTTNIYDETPNLDALMAEFGLSREPGIVVEGDSGHSLYGYPYSLFPDYGATEESAALNGVNKDTHVMRTGSCADRDGGCDRGTPAQHLGAVLQQAERQQRRNHRKGERRHRRPLYTGRLGMQRQHRDGSDLDRLPECGQRTGVSVHSRQPHLPAGLRRFAGRR